MDYRSRKFLLALGILIVSAVALFTGFLDAANWVACASIVSGLYALGNVGERYVEKRGKEACGGPEGEA